MILGKYTIQPMCIYLPDDTKWRSRQRAAKQYFEQEAITDIYWVCGIHAEKFGLKASRPYLRDNPEQNWHLEPRTVGNYLSVYMVFNIALSHPEWKYILYIEDDTRFVDGWKEKAAEALEDTPEDFDWLFLSHCCCKGRDTTHVKGNIYQVQYPMAGHLSIIKREALIKLIANCRDACIPFDVHLFDHGFKGLNVYARVPRIAEQENTFLPE